MVCPLFLFLFLLCWSTLIRSTEATGAKVHGDCYGLQDALHTARISQSENESIGKGEGTHMTTLSQRIATPSHLLEQLETDSASDLLIAKGVLLHFHCALRRDSESKRKALCLWNTREQ